MQDDPTTTMTALATATLLVAALALAGGAAVYGVGPVTDATVTTGGTAAADRADDDRNLPPATAWYLEQAGLDALPDVPVRVHTGDGVTVLQAREAFRTLEEGAAGLDLPALAAAARTAGDGADSEQDEGPVDHVGDIFLSEIGVERDGRTLQCEEIFTGVPVGAGEHDLGLVTVYNGSVGVGDSAVATEGGGLHVDRLTDTTHFHSGKRSTWVGNTDFRCLEVDIPVIGLWVTIHQSDLNAALDIHD